jgi:glycosyltransferase involved in cell wall biosynthesis
MKNIKKVIDMRVFTDLSARGMINAMIGESTNDDSINYLAHDAGIIKLLIENQIENKRIISIENLKKLTKCPNSKYLIISPLQRFKSDILLMRIFRIIEIGTFVHDLHYLSRREALKSEFLGFTKKLKKYVYNFNIFIADILFVDSALVSRQIKKIFNRDTIRVDIKRVFISEAKEKIANSKKFDYYLSLNNRFYKGLWALNKIHFEQSDAKILIDMRFYDIIQKELFRNNPGLKIYIQDLDSDTELQNAYKNSTATIYLSRHEGFGFVPYEAAFFNSIPITLNCTTYLEISKSILKKLPLQKIISIPKLSDIERNIEFQNLARKHIVMKMDFGNTEVPID